MYNTLTRIVASLAFLAMYAWPSPVHAQDWPQRTIKLVVGFGAGGGTDIVARIIAQSLQQKLGQSVVVENKVGGSGLIAADSVAKSEKDGYTLYLVNNAHVILGVMSKALPYDTVKSFDPVGQIAAGGLIVVTNPSFQAKNIEELVDVAKKSPGKITFASVGVGTTQHFTGEMFKQIAGVDLLHIPYRGSPAAIAAILGKQVDILFETVSAVLGQVQSGDLKALAVTSRERFPSVPEVPTAIESGILPDYEVTTWYGLVAALGTPAPMIAKLNKTMGEIASEGVVQERLARAGALPLISAPQEFRQHMEREFTRWNSVRERAGIAQQ
ncbi:MAG TPA: tripartite tricarboxylate transporter substrate binding protein [Bradyrhizobium sp.]|nr:tripartite tricarboxylate transporter substrate binding protein [Bradyrhizobium sp.]